MDLSVFFERYGINILTVFVVVLITQKDAIRGWISDHSASQSLEEEQRRSIEERAWSKALGNSVPSTKDLINRLLAQADNHNEKMRERDVQQERIVSVALSAMQDQSDVARVMLENQEKLIMPLIIGAGEISAVLDRLLEGSAVQVEILKMIADQLRSSN